MILKITQLAKNLSLLIAENVVVCSVVGVSDCKNERVERSAIISMNSNGATDYLIPNAKQAFTQLKQAFTKALIL